MLKYALFALPGTGHKVIEAVSDAGMPPCLIVRGNENEFGDLPIPKVINRTEEIARRFDELEIELALVAGWETRIEESIREKLPRGAWNIHPSLLPRYRGHNPYFWVIANGETETGVTVHRVTESFDAGPIFFQKHLALTGTETLGECWEKLNLLSAFAATEALTRFARGDFATRDQPPGTYPSAPRIGERHLILKADNSRDTNARIVRAANPYYGALVSVDGSLVKVFEVADSGDGPGIPCSDGNLVATVLQKEGFGVLSGKRFNLDFTRRAG